MKAPIKIWKPWQRSQTPMPSMTWQIIYKSEASGFKGTSPRFALFCLGVGVGGTMASWMGEPLLSSSPPTSVWRLRLHVAYFKTGQILWTATWNLPSLNLDSIFQKHCANKQYMSTNKIHQAASFVSTLMLVPAMWATDPIHCFQSIQMVHGNYCCCC